MNSGRELAARRFHRRAVDLLIELGVHLRRRLRETHAAVDHLVHLGGTEVGSHHDNALREIDATIVTQRQRGLIQNP
jgi:hypothetical protein